MANTVNWGVLSTAKIGREHVIPAMQKGTISRITAIASRDQASADRVAAELGIPRAYGSYEALLAIRRSTRSTIRCPIICMCPGRSVPWRPASMCCAKSPSR